MEKVGESISNRLTLKKPLEGEGGEMFYLDDNFDSVVSWLKKTLEMLHSKDLYHGDILGEGNFHIGNIVCELDDGIWKYKLIDFGDKLGETENSYITFGVDSNREVREMSGKQKEEILFKKLFTDEGKYTVELKFFKNKIEMEEKRRKNRNNKTLLYTGKRGRDDDDESERYSKKRIVPPLPMMIDDEDAVAAPLTPTRPLFRPLRLTPSPSPTQSFGTRLQFTPSPGTNRTLFTTPPPLPSPGLARTPSPGLARTLFTTPPPSPSLRFARTPPPLPNRST